MQAGITRRGLGVRGRGRGGIRAGGASGERGRHSDTGRRSGGRDSLRRSQDAGLSRSAGGQEERRCGAGRAQDLRSARVHPRRVSAAGAGGAPGDRTRPLPAAGRRDPDPRSAADHGGCGAGDRRAGALRPRRDGGLGEEERRGPCCAPRHQRLLRGRASGLALLRAQPLREGWGRVVRAEGGTSGWRGSRPQPDRRRGRAARSRARSLRRPGPGHSARHHREDAGGPEKGGPSVADRRLRRAAPRFARRRWPEFSAAGREGRLEAPARVVPQERRGWTL
jgi:hypothetical protein